MDEKTLRDLFAQCDVGWVFEGEGAEAASRRAQQILAQMSDLNREYAKKFGDLPKPIELLILSEVTRFKPLVQSFASPEMTNEMRMMVFCLLKGGQVKAISFEYKRKQRVYLKVEILTESGVQAFFQSDELWDAEVLRHFGLAKLSGAPFIDGYYAFRKSKP